MTWISDAAMRHLRDVADWPVPAGERYEVREALARGGMGTIYVAHDRELDRLVALKVLAATAGEHAVERMRAEARILAGLEHPGIVPVHDVGHLADGRLFYVMQRVRGSRLDVHAAGRPLPERLRLFTRICEPVAFAHAHGVVHRDLKPENVMVGPFGEVLVMDWGVAARLDTRAAAIVGTRAYMPPEQARGEAVDARADVFALGGLLHFLLAGGAPDSTPLSGPRALQAIVRKARASSPADRYPDVQALAADVDRFLQSEPVTASPETVVERVARFGRKHQTAIALIAVYLLLRVLIAIAAR